MGASLRGAAGERALGAGNSIRGSAEADLDRICDRLEEVLSLADFWLADVSSGERVETPDEIGSSDGSSTFLPLSAFGRKGFAEAIINLNEWYGDFA